MLVRQKLRRQEIPRCVDFAKLRRVVKQHRPRGPSIVDGEKLVLDVKKEAHKDEFKDIQVEAIDPNEVAYTYTYSNQLDADQEQANINAKEPELANEISRMREEMNKIGIKDPVVSVRYLNADGAEIWSKKYTG